MTIIVGLIGFLLVVAISLWIITGMAKSAKEADDMRMDARDYRHGSNSHNRR